METLKWVGLGLAVYLGFGFMIGIPFLAETKSQFVLWWLFWPLALVRTLSGQDSARGRKPGVTPNTADLQQIATAYVEARGREPAGATGAIVAALCEKLEKGAAEPPTQDHQDLVEGQAAVNSRPAQPRVTAGEPTVAEVVEAVESTWSRLKQNHVPTNDQPAGGSDSEIE